MIDVHGVTVVMGEEAHALLEWMRCLARGIG